MDFLNNAYKQAIELYESMTPAARITSGLLVAVIVLSLVFLIQFPKAQPDELLLGGTEFSASDLASMEAAFAQEGLNGYERVGNRLRIPRGQRDVYVAALAKNKALPTDFHDIFSRSLSEGGVWEPSKMRDSRMKFAKQRELSMVISAMSGIERATVQYDEQESRSFPRTVHKTAVVAIMPRGSETLSDERADNIIDFMVHAVAGLKPEHVTVTDLKGNRSIVGGSLSSAHGSAKDPYPARKLMYEREWTDKIRRLMTSIPGAAVSVNVELDPVLQQRETSVKVDPKPVIIESFGERRTIASQSTSPGGRPGVVPNTANQPASLSATSAGRSEQKEESTETQRNAVSQDQIAADKAGLVPNRVTVAVTIPTEYYLQIHRQRRPPAAGQSPTPPDAQEMEALEKEVETRLSSTITPLLPKRPAGVDPYPQVVVTRLPDLPPAALVESSTGEQVVHWFGSAWPTLGMLFLGLFGLVTLRSLGGGSEPPPVPVASDEPRPALRVVGGEEPAEEDAEDDGPARRRRRFADGGPDLREELVDLVREDPDAAAKILRNWIGDVA